jgi:hypothetical protein
MESGQHQPSPVAVFEMTCPALSHSQALRVIGQRLHGAGDHSFKLTRENDDYAVQIDPDSLAVNRSIGKIDSVSVSRHSNGDYARAGLLVFKFTPAEILSYDEEAKLRRKRPGALPDFGDLSVVLRVLGDYLDRNSAANFVILRSKHTFKVCVGGQQPLFSLQNLYDLGMIMHLRSSNPHSPKSTL